MRALYQDANHSFVEKQGRWYGYLEVTGEDPIAIVSAKTKRLAVRAAIEFHFRQTKALKPLKRS